MNAHGCELPADGAQRAASSRTATWSGPTSWSGSNRVGLWRAASTGCRTVASAVMTALRMRRMSTCPGRGA